MERTMITKIDSIVRALGALSYVFSEDQDAEYRDLIVSMKHYIITHCKHDKVYDSIDIHPEASQTICYCIHCHTTFP
jgi:hypothetical protein